MLLLTTSATTAIRGLLDRHDLPETAGLRISRTGGEESKFSLGAIQSPKAGDLVIEHGGARVFVGPRAAEVLDNKVLDATVETNGRVRFVVTPQH